jgi:hypothetical protein
VILRAGSISRPPLCRAVAVYLLLPPSFYRRGKVLPEEIGLIACVYGIEDFII